MSDTYKIEVQSVINDQIELKCTPTTSSGMTSYAATRSFVILALAEGARRAKLANDGVTTTLKALGAEVTPFCEVKSAFYKTHADALFSGTELVSRHNMVTPDSEFINRRMDLEIAGKRAAEIEELVPPPYFILRAKAAAPEVLAGFAVGQRLSTTAFDVWWEDPTMVTPPAS